MATLTAVDPVSQHIRTGLGSLRRFTVAQYHAMIEVGILGPADRVELLKGWVVNKMPQNAEHRGTISRTNRWLARVLPESWSLDCQGPITLGDSEPEPDFVIARGVTGTYDNRNPQAMDIGIVIEVGNTSAEDDRRYKGPLYAQEEIAEFWLVDVAQRTIEVFTEPGAGKYQRTVVYRANDAIALVLDGAVVAEVGVDDLIAKQ